MTPGAEEKETPVPVAATTAHQTVSSDLQTTPESNTALSNPIPPEDGKEGIEGDKDHDADGEGECGFCLFMRGGPCRKQFIAWEECVEDADMKEDDIVDKCFDVTGLLKKCMLAHSDYYEPVLRAEKAMEDAEKTMEEEKTAKESPPYIFSFFEFL